MDQKAPTQARAPAGNAGARVTVGCKLPAGLILRVFTAVEVEVPVLGGGMRVEKQYRQDGEGIRVNGNAVPHGTVPDWRIINPKGGLLTDGFGLTSNVPKDFWDRWFEANKEGPLVKSGLVFAYERQGDAEASAKERTDIKSGLEPLQPDKDPRAPRPNSRNLSAVTQDDGKKDAA